MNKSKTARGFINISFQDEKGQQCSLQESSLATDDCIWFGVDKPDIIRMINGRGWADVKLPEDSIICSRMHLNREQVIEILPHLQSFVEKGTL